MKPTPPFRLGTTSYIIPAGLVPNVRHLGPVVDDVELVLFDTGDLCNYPSPAEIDQLNLLAHDHALSYTVHLPLDLQLAESGDLWDHPSMAQARRVIRATKGLSPWAYVAHLDGKSIQNGAGPAKLAQWRDQAGRALEAIGQEIGNPNLLALENLENYPPEAFLPLTDELPIGLCIDIGHFFKIDRDPFPILETYLARASVLHLHGSQNGRDHRGLELIPPATLERLLKLLLTPPFRGVLTLEVFQGDHFYPGRDRILALMETLQ